MYNQTYLAGGAHASLLRMNALVSWSVSESAGESDLSEVFSGYGLGKNEVTDGSERLTLVLLAKKLLIIMIIKSLLYETHAQTSV